jgi:hypothetical protein
MIDAHKKRIRVTRILGVTRKRISYYDKFLKEMRETKDPKTKELYESIQKSIDETVALYGEKQLAN